MKFDLAIICHDNMAILEHWENQFEDRAKGFDHPGDLLDYLKSEIGFIRGKRVIFIFDRMMQKGIDILKIRLTEEIRSCASDLKAIWVLASNHHNLGDRISGWDLVKDGYVTTEEELIELLDYQSC